MQRANDQRVQRANPRERSELIPSECNEPMTHPIQTLLYSHEVDVLLLTSLPNIRWACGFSGSNGLLIVTKNSVHFITDGRYDTQSREEVRGASIHITQGNLFAYASENDLLSNAGRVLVQSDHLTVSNFQKVQELFAGIEWIPVSGLLTKLIAQKTSDEVTKIRAAQAITDDVFTYLMKFIQPGMTEREIAAEIVYQHLKRGASAMSFEPIVAGGPNGALPHATPTKRKLQNGDLVVIDMGCFRDGYASDMTRTIAIGEPGEEARRAHEVVLKAQKAAIEQASPAMNTKELDAVARSVIDEAGYGEYFTHSLGHGVGLEIHEWPRVSWRTEDPLMAGMVVTVEPGVYIPGKFGIRIEDMVVLTEDGCEVLTKSSKELWLVR